MITFFILTFVAALLIFDCISAILGMGKVQDKCFEEINGPEVILCVADRDGLKDTVTKYGTLELKNNDRAYQGSTQSNMRENSSGYENNISAANGLSEGSGRSDSNKRSSPENKPQKLLLTWMINDIRLFKMLDGVISEEDFYDEDIYPIAKELFNQYRETGTVKPASILNVYDDVDKQRLAASIMQTELPFEMDEDEKEKAINDLVKKTKAGYIDWKLPQCTDDAKMFQELIVAKAGISKLHISLKNG